MSAHGQYAKSTRHNQHTTSRNNSGTIYPVFSSVVFQDLLCRVQLAGSKPEILGFIITGPLHQVLRFSTDDTVLPDGLDFVVFFAINL